MSDRVPEATGTGVAAKSAHSSSESAAANLLFGLLALHNGLITRHDLVAATSAWLENKSEFIQDILVNRGALSVEDCHLVTALVGKHLAQHGDDPRKSLAELTSLASVRKDLDDLDDPDIESSLGLIGAADADPYQTISVSLETSNSGHRRFRPLYLHAKGGLGEVFVAQDEELDRHVALKQIQLPHADSQLSRLRFVQEAEVTGKLEHPGIVPVYGRGADNGGRPFYAMRLIKGQSLKQEISRFHERHKKAWRSANARIALRGLLRHYIDICNTVEYAHTRGVLHRDLKPANVMLGKYGETLIVDWGLAKPIQRLNETEETESDEPSLHLRDGSGSAPTRQGTTLGTLGYMSPEQSAGRMEVMGPTSDVYSLGAILYCLLTGRSSQDLQQDMETILKNIREGRFPRPRQLKPQIPRPLESICLKAMALEPKNRYTSSRELAEDIECWIADERVAAHREYVVEKTFRLARRYRGRVGAAIAIFAIAACSTIAFLAVRDAERNRREAVANAERSRSEAIANLKHAQQAIDTAREAVDTWYTVAADDLRDVPGGQVFRMQILRQAAEDYQDLVRNANDDADVETERGRTLLRLGDIHEELGETDTASDYFTEAKNVFQRLLKRDASNHRARLELANSFLRLGDLNRLVIDNAQQAEQQYASAMDTLSPHTDKYDEDGKWREVLGTCLLRRGLIRLDREGFEQAEEDLRKAIREFQQAVDLETANPHYLRGLSSARLALGKALRNQNRLAEGERLIREAVAATEELVDKFSARRDVIVARAEALTFLTDIMRSSGRYREELQVTQSICDDYRALKERYPEVVRYAEDAARHQMDLGQIHHLLGDSRQAEANLRVALESFHQLASQYPMIQRYREERAVCHGNLCHVLSSLNKNQEALEHGNASLSGLQWLAMTRPDLTHNFYFRSAIVQSHMAQALSKSSQPEQAATLFQQAVTTIDTLRAHNRGDFQFFYPDALATVNNHWASFLWSRGEKDAAREKLDTAFQLWTDITSEADRTTPDFQHNFARFLVTCVERQEGFAAKAIEMAGLARAETPQNADYTGTLGAAHYRAGNYDDAIRWLQSAVELRQDGNAFDHFFLAMAKSKANGEDAETSYLAGNTWLEDHQPGHIMLQRLAEEARGTLGLREQDAAGRSPTSLAK